jgi:transglutaminase-like putative cysteine protease
MKLLPQYESFTPYLESDEIIDFGDKNSLEISNLSYDITNYTKNIIEYIKNGFEYVRDNISHSADINGKIITCKASEVFKAKEGICYAKSHLLAAILRCNKIPTGFCYQKLMLDEGRGQNIVLHGLNAVYIEELKKWIRLDARGNKAGINSQFSLSNEKLAFPVRPQFGEGDIPIIFAKPDKNVINVLCNSRTFEELWNNLPKALDSEKIF